MQSQEDTSPVGGTLAEAATAVLRRYRSSKISDWVSILEFEMHALQVALSTVPPTGLVGLGEQSNTESSQTTTSAAPSSPPAVVDYTERAQSVWYEIQANWPERSAVGSIRSALSAVASEYQAALKDEAEAAWAMCRVLKAEIAALKHDIVRYQAIASSEAAGHSEALARCQEQRHRAQDAEAANMALLARLGEPDVREAVAEAAWNGWIHYRDVDEVRWSQLTQRQQGAWRLAMDAARAVMTEKLNG